MRARVAAVAEANKDLANRVEALRVAAKVDLRTWKMLQRVRYIPAVFERSARVGGEFFCLGSRFHTLCPEVSCTSSIVLSCVSLSLCAGLRRFDGHDGGRRQEWRN